MYILYYILCDKLTITVSCCVLNDYKNPYGFAYQCEKRLAGGFRKEKYYN